MRNAAGVPRRPPPLVTGQSPTTSQAFTPPRPLKRTNLSFVLIDTLPRTNAIPSRLSSLASFADTVDIDTNLVGREKKRAMQATSRFGSFEGGNIDHQPNNHGYSEGSGANGEDLGSGEEGSDNQGNGDSSDDDNPAVCNQSQSGITHLCSLGG